MPPAADPDPPGHRPAGADDSSLFAAVYQELHGIARGLLAHERPGHTLQPTALLHEAWLRLQQNHDTPPDRAAWLRAAAGTMRRILVDHARGRARHKRGGGAARTDFDPDRTAVTQADPDTVLAIDETLRCLEAMDPELARLLELRVFAGLTHPEIAATTGRSVRTVERDWRLCRALLLRALGDDHAV